MLFPTFLTTLVWCTIFDGSVLCPFTKYNTFICLLPRFSTTSIMWIDNYYVKCSSNNLSNENTTLKRGGQKYFRKVCESLESCALVFPEKLFFKNSSFWHFNSHFGMKHLFYITKKKHRIKNQQFFDEHFTYQLMINNWRIEIHSLSWFFLS